MIILDKNIFCEKIEADWISRYIYVICKDRSQNKSIIAKFNADFETKDLVTMYETNIEAPIEDLSVDPFCKYGNNCSINY